MSNDGKSDKTEHKLCFLFNKVIDLGTADFNPSAASNEPLTESNDPNAARARDPELPKTPDAYKDYISSSEDLIDSLEKAKKEKLKKKYEEASQAFAKRMSEDKIRREFKDKVRQKAEEVKKNEAMKKEEQFVQFMGKSRESITPNRTDNETYRRESTGRDREMIKPSFGETQRRESAGRDQELGGDKPTLLFDEIQIRESAIGCQDVRNTTRRFRETQIKESAISSQDVRESTREFGETHRSESDFRSQDIRERGSAIGCQDVRELNRKSGETHRSESDFRSQDIRERRQTRRDSEIQRPELDTRIQDIREKESTQRDSETQRSEATNQMSKFSDIDFLIMEIKQIFKDDRASRMVNTEIDTLYKRTFKTPIRKDWLQVLEKHEDFEVISTGITTLWVIRLKRANESKL